MRGDARGKERNMREEEGEPRGREKWGGRGV